MIEFLTLQRFIIALALGALIGLEREYAQRRDRGHYYAGIRTFPLISLFGALAAYLGETISPWIVLISLLFISTLVLIAYFAITDKKHIGATSEVAGVLAFFIGILSYYEEFTLAIILAVIITLVLYARSFLHHFAEHIKKKELGATLKFAVVAFVILPFLPNQGYGPSGIFNPYLLWLIVVFVSGISLVGYILLKWFGEKGIALTGILAGLVSSTATTISFAQRSLKEKKIHRALALGIILANGVMFVRVLFEVFVLNKELFVMLILPLGILVLITALFSYFFWKHSNNAPSRIPVGSPFTVLPALKFALIFAVILALVKMAHTYLSSQGVYLVSFLSGFADVDAITVSLSQLAQKGLAVEVARDGVIIAVLTNIAVKGGLAYWLGGEALRKIVMGFFAVLVIVGTVLVVLL